MRTTAPSPMRADCALHRPQVLGGVWVGAPATWFAKESRLRYKRHHPVPPASRFYLIVGSAESETMLPLLSAVRKTLLDSGVPASRLAFKTPTDGQHAEWFWRREFGLAYR